MASVWSFTLSIAHCEVVCSLSLVKAEEEASALHTPQFWRGEKGTWPQRRDRNSRGFILFALVIWLAGALLSTGDDGGLLRGCAGRNHGACCDIQAAVSSRGHGEGRSDGKNEGESEWRVEVARKKRNILKF